MHNSVNVADYFIELSLAKKGYGLSMMQVMKLPYIANGYTLALTNEPLIYDRPEVWTYGPVYTNIYRAFFHQPSPKELPEGVSIGSMHFYKAINKLRSSEERIMAHTYKLYEKCTNETLSYVCHTKNSPWYKARQEGLKYIPNEYIKEHYSKLIEDLPKKKD